MRYGFFNKRSSFLNITEKASERIKEICKFKKKNIFLRIAVDSGGCSGFLYEFNLENKKNDFDICIEKNGSSVLIDSVSLIYLKGATLDWETSLTKCKFGIRENPNIENGCGCGISFILRED